jgi:hypothetical protein
MKKRRLGEVLYERGQIPAAELKKALLDQPGRVIPLGELLLERKLVTKQELLAANTDFSGIPYQDCSAIDPSAEALRAIPVAAARCDLCVPVQIDGNSLVVAMAKPQKVQILDELRFKKSPLRSRFLRR